MEIIIIMLSDPWEISVTACARPHPAGAEHVTGRAVRIGVIAVLFVTPTRCH